MKYAFSDISRNLILKWIIIIIIFSLVQFLDWTWRRIIHVIASFGWWGLVFFLVVILLPILSKMSSQTQHEIIGLAIPRIFRSASILGFFSVGMGWRTAMEISNWDLTYFFINFSNMLLLVGGLVGTGLYLFHVFLEHHEIEIAMRASKVTSLNLEDPEVKDLIKKIQLIPRVGFLIITFSALSMFLH